MACRPIRNSYDSPCKSCVVRHQKERVCTRNTCRTWEGALEYGMGFVIDNGKAILGMKGVPKKGSEGIYFVTWHINM